MPLVTIDKALELMTHEVRRFDIDEQLEVHNELFPDDAYTQEEAHRDVTPLIERLVARINRVDVGEIVDLWGLIFPRHRNIWYDDEDDRLHYDEEAEAVSSE